MSTDYSHDSDRFPIFNKVRNDHDIHVYIEEQNNRMRLRNSISTTGSITR